MAVLDVEAADLREGAGGGARVGDELGDDGELGVGVDGLARAVEGRVAHAVGVIVAAVAVAETLVAGGAGVGAAISARAGGLLGHRAWVWRVGRGDGVGLPDVHLGAAGTGRAAAGVGVVAGWGPALDVGLVVESQLRANENVGKREFRAHLAVDEFQVRWALRVAVASTVLGAGLVATEAGLATVRVHVDEVERAIETTW